MEHIINQAEESASRVLRFYESVGTPLSYLPRFQYIEGIYPQMPNALAMVQGEFETLESNIRFLSQNLAKTIWGDVYRIDVSDEAIAEITEIQINKFGKILIPTEFGPEADILILQPYQDHCKKQEDRDEIIAHEIWHLIENERRLFKEHLFIREGTATYAMKRFRNSLKDEDTRKAVAFTLRKIPEFQRLEGNLTPEGILNAYKEMGANKIADELKGKDLEGLMYWFRVVGF